jgi:hypothetical protein
MEIAIRTKKNGKRSAYRYETRQFRFFPMSLAEAELMLATGQASLIPIDVKTRSDKWYLLPEFQPVVVPASLAYTA